MTRMPESIENVLLSLKENVHKTTFFYLLFLIAILLLSFVAYIVIFASPSGTDVYTHMFNTQNMANSQSLSDFYENSLNQEYAGFDYPFGLWYFGSILMKITGLDIYTIAYIIPLLLLFITLAIFFCYAYELTSSTDQSLLSLIFLVSMTQLALALLNYSTSIFVMPFLVAILYLAMRDITWKSVLLIGILVFTLCFSHTGTFLFLITFVIAYFLLRAWIWGKFDYNFYIVIVILLFCFIIAIGLFPFVQPQYIDKGTLVISITKSISSATHITFFKDAGQIFYDSIFVANNYVFAFLWAALLFAAGSILVFINQAIRKRFTWESMPAAIPFFDNLTTMGKGIITTPFWIGPLQTFFSVFGIFRLDERGKCTALTLIIAVLIPGLLAGSSGTGAIRETFYLFLFIPITAALGFYFFYTAINRVSRSALKRVLIVLLYIVIFVPLIAIPIVACLHYQPTITMTKEENVDLLWLGSIGNPMEGAAGTAYRDRMSMYANKTVPSVSSGTETVRFLNDLKNVYFSGGADSEARDLSNHYQIQYIISSERILKGYSFPRSAVAIDTNNEIDKIYASGSFFGFYKIISRPEIPVTPIDEPLSWDSRQPEDVVQDIGSVFLFENPSYKVKLSDSSSRIRYFGTPVKNSIGEGYFTETMTIGWRTVGNDTQYTTFDLGSLSYAEIQRSDKEIIYRTTVTSKQKERIASLTVKYIFYDEAVKREITVANDLDRENRTQGITVNLVSTIFSPMTDFDYHQVNPGRTTWINKKIYPAQDQVYLDDTFIDRIFFNDASSGIFILYDPTAPYPNKLWYLGSPSYNYGIVTLQSDYSLDLGEATTTGQYFSFNNKETAMRNAEKYSSVSAYPFPDAQVPLIISGTVGDTEFSDREKNALAVLTQNSIPYTLGIPGSLPAGTPGLTGIDLAVYGRPCYNSTVCKTLAEQTEELKLFRQNNPTTGFLLSQVRYDLNTLRSLSENQYSSAEVDTVPAPFGPIYREGMRNPKFAFVEGQNTGVVLIPATEPSSDLLNHRSEPDPVFSQWNTTINSVISGGGVAAFHWELSDIGNPDFTNIFTGFINNTTARGLTVTTPDAVARHIKDLAAVRVNVTGGDQYVILNARNTEEQPLSGITYKVVMPVIENVCPYTVTNGELARYEIRDGACQIYASFSLDGFDAKEIKIAPSGAIKRLFPQIPELFQGQNTIRVVDEHNQPVVNATVLVDTQYYKTDRKGEVRFSVNHGKRAITVEKGGYASVTVVNTVKPVIYRYLPFLNR